jgi:hypothetical protein
MAGSPGYNGISSAVIFVPEELLPRGRPGCGGEALAIKFMITIEESFGVIQKLLVAGSSYTSKCV